MENVRKSLIDESVEYENKLLESKNEKSELLKNYNLNKFNCEIA